MKTTGRRTKFQNLLASAAIIAFGILITLLLFYPSSSPLGSSFTVEAILLLARQASWVLGIILLACRLISILKKDNLIYSTLGMLNLLMGLYSLILYLFSIASPAWAHLFIINFAIGISIYADIFLLDYLRK